MHTYEKTNRMLQLTSFHECLNEATIDELAERHLLDHIVIRVVERRRNAGRNNGRIGYDDRYLKIQIKTKSNKTFTYLCRRN